MEIKVGYRLPPSEEGSIGKRCRGCKTTFTAKDVRAFLLGQSVRKTTLLKKNGTKFTASLVMQDDPNSPYGPNFTFGEGLDR